MIYFYYLKLLINLTLFNICVIGSTQCTTRLNWRGMLSVNGKNCHVTRRIDIGLKWWKDAQLIELS